MEAENPSKLSILMYPWLAYGHMFPFLELAKRLSHKNFTIYFCSTPVNLVSINNELKKTPCPSIRVMEIHLPSSPDLPPQYHTTKNVPKGLKPKLYQAFKMSSSNFSSVLTTLKPDLFLYDVHQPWAVKLALSMNIPAVHFSITGAASNSFFTHHFSENTKNLPYPYPAMYIREHELKSLLLDVAHVTSDKSYQGYKGHFGESTNICLIKSWRGIEGKYIDYLSDLHARKMLLVGLLITRTDDKENDAEVMKWLSEKSKFSTVYISFGSENFFSKDEIEEIAKGLENCDVNFIWVIKSQVEETQSIGGDDLPEGFLERTGERCLIVRKWVPQDNILSHKSIGAFMSHCGMSSTLESLYFGVPVIALPLKLDNHLNARLLVEAGVGVEVETDDSGKLRGEEITKAINKAFLGKTAQDFRVKAGELAENMKNEDQDAVNDEVAQQLREICLKNKHINKK